MQHLNFGNNYRIFHGRRCEEYGTESFMIMKV
jgi:hypothetical protein